MSNPWHKHYHADALNGMAGLPVDLRGVYYTLLDMMYDTRAPLGCSDQMFAARMCCSVRKWKSYRDALIGMDKIHFTKDGKLSNKRFENELKISRKRAENGAKGGRVRSENSEKPKENNDRQQIGLKQTPKPQKPEARVRGDSLTNVRESKNSKKEDFDCPKFQAIWGKYRDHFNRQGLRTRVGGKTKAFDRWRIQVGKFGAEAVEAFCLAHLRETDPKYVKGLVPLLNTGGAENFLKAKAEPDKQKPKAIPEWQRAGYDSKQHWIDCDYGNIAPHAVNGVLIPDHDPYQVLAS